MKIFKQIMFSLALLWLCQKVSAQTTYEDMSLILVNENVTTLVTASEPIGFVDISTDKVAADEPLSNTLRLKPKDGDHEAGDLLGIVTILTETYRTQYALLYTPNPVEAVTDKEIDVLEQVPYLNPNISMSEEDMYSMARKVWLSRPKYRNVSNKHSKLFMRLNNVYAVGEYFFIDFTVENKTNIRFDIDELRIKLKDKKTSKATNAQTIELEPAIVLDKSQSFLHAYRNVIVIKKLTFPNDKVLSLELSEKQISGRTISITIDYEDILSADSFDKNLK